MDASTLIVFGLLMSLQAYAGDKEGPAERRDRMQMIAKAIGSATCHATCTGSWASADDWCKPMWPSSTREQVNLRVLLVTLGFEETKFAKHVHAGRCRGMECDAVRLPNGRIYYKAKSPWQLQQTGAVKNQWRHIKGASSWSTYNAAYGAARVLGYSRRVCERRRANWLTGSISVYATGKTCHWSRSGYRAAKFKILRKKYYKLKRQQTLPPSR